MEKGFWKENGLQILLVLFFIVLLAIGYSFNQKEEKRRQEREIIETAQKVMEYAASQKKACFEIYKQEASRYDNVVGWEYTAESDTCEVEYKFKYQPTEEYCNTVYKDKPKQILYCWFGTFLKEF